MIKLISRKAACILCKNEESDEMRELYEYAIYVLLSGLFHLISVIVLGLCFGMILEGLVFYCSFILIRKFAGGYHAKTPTRCYLFSVTSSVVVFGLIKLIDTLNFVGYYVFVSVVLLCALFIIIRAPLDNDNKPLNTKEKKMYKIISVVMTCFMLVILLLLKCNEINNLSIAISFGIIMCAMVLFFRNVQIYYQKQIKNTE